MVVTALGNPQVGVPGRRGENSGPVLGGGVDVAQTAGPEILLQDLGNGLGDVPVAAGAQDAVHLRQLFQNVLPVALGHAAGDQDFFQLPGLFQL